jgi:hypothetical protein
MIVKGPRGFYVMSSDGEKRLGGPYDSEAEAMKRLEEIEYFKRRLAGGKGGR